LSPKSALRAIAARSRAERSIRPRNAGRKRLYDVNGNVIAEWVRVGEGWRRQENSLPYELRERSLGSFLPAANLSGGASLLSTTTKSFQVSVSGYTSYDTLWSTSASASSTSLSEDGSTYGTTIADFQFNSGGNTEKLEHATAHESWAWVNGPEGWVALEVVLDQDELTSAKNQFVVDTAGNMPAYLRMADEGVGSAASFLAERCEAVTDEELPARRRPFTEVMPHAEYDCKVLEQQFRAARARSNFLGLATVGVGFVNLVAGGAVAALYVTAKADYVAKGYELLECYLQEIEDGQGHGPNVIQESSWQVRRAR
jgi:hypothetical protein